MATFNSDKISSGIIKLLPLGYNQSILGTVAASSVLGTADVYNMVNLSSDASLTSGDGKSTGGPTIIGIALGCDGIDAGASLSMSVGDSSSSTRYIATSTIGQSSAGGRVASTKQNSLGYQPFATPTFATYTTPSLQTYLIQVKVVTSAATALAGNIRLLVDFTIDP